MPFYVIHESTWACVHFSSPKVIIKHGSLESTISLIHTPKIEMKFVWSMIHGRNNAGLNMVGKRVDNTDFHNT